MRKKLQLLFTLLLALPLLLLAAGSSWDTATTLSLGGSATGTLSSAQSQDWYKITITEDGAITIQLTPSGNLALNYSTLYALDGNNEIHKRGDMWGTGNFTVKDCSKGTYYLVVKRNSGEGSYTVSNTFARTSATHANDQEPNDTWDYAQPLAINATTTGHLGYLYYNDTDKTDWYKIEVPENGALNIKLTPADGLGLNYSTLYALDGNNEVHKRGDMWGTGDFTVIDCAKGTYYLAVKQNNGEGGYTLVNTFTPTSATYKDDVEPNDTWDYAQPLAINATTTGHLGYLYYNDTDKTDWYKIDVPENGALNIKLTPADGLGLNYSTLYALDGNNEVHRRGDMWGTGDFTVVNCAKGTYYLAVRQNNGEGGYTLVDTFTPTSASYKDDQEPNDTWDYAKRIKLGNTVTGHLGYLYYDDTDKIDWWKIELPRDAAIKLNIVGHDKLGLNYSTIYTINDKNETYKRSDIWGNGDFGVSDAAAGDYYVAVRQNTGEGAYSLQYRLEQLPYATDQEPNDEIATALPLAAGATAAGHLGYKYVDNADNQDIYQLSMPAKGDLTVTYQAIGNLGFNYVTLLDSQGREKKSLWGNGENNTQTMTVKDLDAGTYYLRMKQNTGEGCYLVSYAATLGTVEQQEPLPDEPSDDPTAQIVPDDGTGTQYTYNPEDQSLKVVSPSSTAPYDFTCRYPGSGPGVFKVIIVIFPYDIFKHLGPGDVKVGAETPPVVEGGDFDTEDVGGRILHVPSGSEGDYEKDPNWSKFGEIKGDYGKPASNPAGPKLIVWLKSGEKVVYELADAPVTTFNNGYFIIRTNTANASYPRHSVQRYTYEDVMTGIDLQPGERRVHINREGDEVVFRGLQDGTTASIYTVGGQLVGQVKATDNAPLTISLQNRPTGVYIIKAGTETIKIMKK